MSGKAVLGMSILCVALTASMVETKADVKRLATRGLCTFSIFGVKISDSIVIGDERDLLLLLERFAQIRAHDCAYLLSKHPSEQTEIQWLIATKASAESAPTAQLVIGQHVRMAIVAPEEFLRMYGAAGGRDGTVPPSGPPTSKTEEPRKAGMTEGEPCGSLSEICINREGEASFEFSCGPLMIEVSTSGHFGVGIQGTTGGASISIP